MTIVGIDPGVNGAVAFIVDESKILPYVSVVDIPTVKVRRGGQMRTEYNASECGQLLCHMDRPARVFLEDVRARPARDGQRDSLVSAHRIGVGIGLWLGIAGAFGIPVEMVTPQAWKRKLGLLRCDKEASRHMALQRFPQLAHRLRRKCDHNRAEALLIAEYGRMKL